MNPDRLELHFWLMTCFVLLILRHTGFANPLQAVGDYINQKTAIAL